MITTTPQATDSSPLPVKINSRKTAFGELLVGQLYPQFQGSFEYTVDNTDLNTNTVTNGGTVTQASGMCLVGSSVTTNSTALFQSARHARYKSGLGGELRFSALFTAPVAATEQLIGLADETGSSVAFKNGYMVGYIGTTFGYHRFQNDAIVTVALADFDDPLDGTGTSGMTLDQTKLNVFFISYQYLGAGAITISIEDDSTGFPVAVHTELYANNNTQPSTHNPNFYHTVWTNNKATISDLIIKSASYAYFVQGKTTHIELHQPQNSSGLIEKTTVTTEVAIFTIRNKSTYQSKNNFIDILIEHFSVSIEASSANNLAVFHLTKNATLGGSPSYSDINTANSVADIDTAGTTVTGGTGYLHPQLAGKNDQVVQNLSDLSIIIAPGETITLSAQSANSATVRGHMLWKEMF